MTLHIRTLKRKRGRYRPWSPRRWPRSRMGKTFQTTDQTRGHQEQDCGMPAPVELVLGDAVEQSVSPVSGGDSAG